MIGGAAATEAVKEPEAPRERLVELAIALSAERNLRRLLERFVTEAQHLTNAEGGTLYLLSEDRRRLHLAILRNTVLDLRYGGLDGTLAPFPPIELERSNAAPSLRSVAGEVAVTGRTILVDDAYRDPRFDLQEARAFDARTGYRTRSLLSVPVADGYGEVTGVLQLVNARSATGEPVGFAAGLQPLVEALAALAGVALDNRRLLDGQKRLFKAFVAVIANAIDAKSAHTGAHCKRVPELTLMLARAACAESEGPFQDFLLSEEEWEELEIAAGLHDCGKVTTPEWVMDKATKLQTIRDGMDVVRARFAALKAAAERDHWRARVASQGESPAQDSALRQHLAGLDSALSFLERCNDGRDPLPEGAVARIRDIAAMPWPAPGGDAPLLSPEEVECLSIPVGTLTEAERRIVNGHVVATIDMLRQLPFPPSLARVVDIAGGHHERLDGSGYPRQLTARQLSMPARMLAVADIFEALTAADRPYKHGRTLSESVTLLADMAGAGKVDADVVALLLRSGVYRTYAERHMRSEQIDPVDARAILARLAAEDGAAP